MSFLKTKFAKLELYMFHQCLKKTILNYYSEALFKLIYKFILKSVLSYTLHTINWYTGIKLFGYRHCRFLSFVCYFLMGFLQSF